MILLKSVIQIVLQLFFIQNIEKKTEKVYTEYKNKKTNFKVIILV